MIDVRTVAAEFPELSDITLLPSTSGQKEVVKAKYNSVPVILKLVKQKAIHDKRTQRELDAVQKIGGSYIPRVVEAGQRNIAGQLRFYVIEDFIDGETYRDRLTRQPVQQLHAILRFGEALLLACADFEAVAIVHRDLKPENLIIDKQEKLWILDFGIARHLNLSSITPTGPFGVGTPGYAAPEQFRNIKGQINSRTDLFAVGIILYESLCGYNPLTRGLADPHAILQRTENMDLLPLTIPGDTGELSRFINTLAQRFPSRRPQTAREAAEWFQPIKQDVTRK
jgi:serine/threonine-protein kinase